MLERPKPASPTLRWGRFLLVILLAASPRLLGQQASPIRVKRADVSIGSLDGAEPYVFGEITDAVSTPLGIVIIDSRLNSVRMFDAHGRFLETIGRAGAGPGEFVHPIAATVDGFNLFILDDGTERISVFNIRGRRATYIRAITLPFSAFDVCTIDGKLAVLGFYKGRTIHLFDSQKGLVTRSFGPTWGPNHPLLNRTLAQGFLACSTNPKLVVAVSALIPDVRAFRPDGSLAWEQHIQGFVPVALTPAPANGVTYSEPPEGFNHAVLSLVALMGNRILLQYGKITKASTGLHDTEDVNSIVYDSNGRLISFQDNLPRIVSSRMAIAVSAADDPFPSAAIHSYELGQ